MCATCPFREGSPYAYLRLDLEVSALTRASRICHSTGKDNAIHKRTGKPESLCRGARDSQLNLFYKMGFIDAPTDQEWNRRCVEMGLAPNKLEDNHVKF
jgi:hypothetical protein